MLQSVPRTEYLPTGADDLHVRRSRQIDDLAVRLANDRLAVRTDRYGHRHGPAILRAFDSKTEGTTINNAAAITSDTERVEARAPAAAAAVDTPER
ncbi:hypothetical protein JZU54_05070, partial [bacterium]|nr:hypothetical protein [bacterium]